MHRIFQTFVDRLLECGSARDFADTMMVTATALDLPCFAYLSLPNNADEKPRLITTYPSKWTTHYLRCGYEQVDPVIVKALRHTDSFKWGLDLFHHREPSATQLFEEAASFGIRAGFTIPLRDRRGSAAALTFASDRRTALFENCIASHSHALQLIAISFHTHIRRKLPNGRSVNGVLLSPREIECLQWASQGKSAWEIGQILGISRNTAADYLNNAKKKLGVRTIVQAVTRLAAATKEKQN
jgi:DNA-binding CsgD family transcriptional regulator